MDRTMRQNPSHAATGDVDLERRATLRQLAILATLSVSPSLAFASSRSEPFDEDVYKVLLKISGWITGFHTDFWSPYPRPHWPSLNRDLSYLQLMKDITTLLILSDGSNKQKLPKLVKRFQQAGETINDAAYKADMSSYQPLLKAWYLSQVELPREAVDNPEVQRICGNLRGLTSKDFTDNVIGQISYDEALTWQACTFTKPSATCGGPFGYWQDPPPEHKTQTADQAAALSPLTPPLTTDKQQNA